MRKFFGSSEVLRGGKRQKKKPLPAGEVLKNAADQSAIRP
ncbi:hypothetical protein CHCC20335_3401 [Bacillus paralicheniformis]|nr:hypothetical protein CHCC20335_3401 [Bacillus paralicheniformis]